MADKAPPAAMMMPVADPNLRPMADVRGKTAFITGGANGIGLGIARALVNAGANVVIADIRESALAEAKASLSADAQVETVQLDVTDRAGFAAAADKAEARFGKIHMLIGNAGIGVMGPVLDAKYDDWDWGMGVNLGGVINGFVTILPRIKAHGEGGQIVTTSSQSALIPISYSAIYTAAKAAVMGISEAIRGELAAANSTRTLLKNSDQVQHYGLLRHTQHAHGVLDYTFSPHISAQVLAGYNHETWSNIIDLDGQDSAAGSFNWPYEIDDKQRDWSVEGRLNYTYGKLHGVVGASYLSAQGQQALATLGGTYTASGPSTTKTFGAFFGATYDVTSKLSASFEGRYQIDTIGAYFGGGKTYTDSLGYLPAGTYASGSLIGQKSFNNFLPRIIVNYQINPSLMVYASWSKGVNPSTYNSYVMALSTTLQGLAKSSGVPLFANPEKVTNYEIGAKGKLLNGRLRYSGALYYAQWTDQVNAQQVGYYQSTDGSVVSTTQSTATPLYNFYNAYLNTGAVDMYGVELNGTYKMNDLITIDAGGAMNASRIINYKDSSLTALYGITNFYGKEMPHTSKYSANVGVTFGGDVKGYANATWFLRGDWNFKSGMWSDQANVTRTRDLHLFNARLGGTMGRYSASLFMNNIFNNHTAVSINNNYAINSYSGYFSALSAVQVGLPDLRTFGVQLKVKI